MKKLLSVLSISILLWGCGKKVEAPQMTMAPAPAASLMRSVAAESQSTVNRQDSTLAYEHRVEVEMPADLLAARVDAVRAACAADKEGKCTLLEISNRIVNDVPEGYVRMRIAPGGMDAFVKMASEGGRLIDSRTHAEDLAQPLADTERQLSLLNLHRQRLTEFMGRKDIGIEQLITVSRELASVQSQLEDYGSQKANLRRRVDTELLTISWRAPYGVYQSAQTPVRDALRAFGANFREAVSQVIVFLAYVVPWLIIAVPGLFALRWLWRWIGAKLQRRAAQ